MPQLTGLLETALYVTDLERSRKFFVDLLDLEVLHSDHRFCALSVAGHQVLLLFLQGASTKATKIPGGTVPPHDGRGQLHMAMSIPADQWEPWTERLAAASVEIESVVQWERGGRSMYFRDPDGHALEFVTPGCWRIY